MIHIELRTGDHVCDQCEARLKGDVSDRDRNTFLHVHGQCRAIPSSAANPMVIWNVPPPVTGAR
jgi:hypothetical protein